jgi:hypothetical protein
MGHVLEPLLHDLAERFRFLEDELGKIVVPPEAETSRNRIHQIAAKAKQRVDEVLNDPDFSRPEFAKNFYHTYKRLSELAQAIDEGPLFALSRFRMEDRFLTRLVQAACEEFRFPEDAPICVAMSSQYYCTTIEMNLILIPHGEATHLLGWADLYHELGHFIVARHESTVLKPLMDLVGDHFAKAIDEASRLGWPTAAIEELRLYRQLWMGDWIVEFACDLVATFATKLSFAWSNLRLCARMSTDVFSVVKSHPADAARTEVILQMLALVSDSKEQEFVEDSWGELLKIIGAVEPQAFRTAYPKALLRKLAIQAKESFETLGLKPYASNEDRIADLLNEAWKHFQSHPKSFAEWESTQIEGLRNKLGLGG